MEVLEAIKTRGSIRRYKTTPVDDKTIELVLEAAHSLGLGTVHVGCLDAKQVASLLGGGATKFLCG